MPRRAYRLANFTAGAAAVIALAFASNAANGPRFIGALAEAADAAKLEAGGAGIEVSFRTREGWWTRHPALSGGEGVGQEARSATALAISAIPGVGGVSWRDADGVTTTNAMTARCSEDIKAVLAVRTIRFDEASARIDAGSEAVLDEVARALEPCVGSIVAITGHTDSNGNEAANLALSRARADAVRWALIGRGIPADGLRAQGKGSQEPVAGIASDDPANRRIEFAFIEMVPLQPTPIDTPGPG